MARRRRLIWADPALDDLDDIAAWIATDDPRAAARLVRKVLHAVERLRDHPDSGRHLPEVPKGRYREVIAPPLRIIYRREDEAIVIVVVMRGERQLRPERLG